MKFVPKKILIAPLNWGLGHATRCIPIINALQNEGFIPIIAGDGVSFQLLKKEFPKLKTYDLPSYNIQYSKNGKFLKYKLLMQLKTISKAVKKEQKVVDKIVSNENICGIISDNRFGVKSKKVPSVYITHQINVLSGLTTFITSKFHQNIISKFDECWVPDFKTEPNLSGRLSHNTKLNLKYIGSLSRFKLKNYDLSKESDTNNGFDILVILSGPEPQRTILEKKLLKKLEFTNKKVLFVKGIISEKQEIKIRNNITIVNFMLQNKLRKAIIESGIIIARSGYSTIMDLQTLNAKVFFIPTEGQAEQEYLAKYLSEQGIAPFVNQKKFDLSCLDKISSFKGFGEFKTNSDINKENLFEIFNNTNS